MIIFRFVLLIYPLLTEEIAFLFSLAKILLSFLFYGFFCLFCLMCLLQLLLLFWGFSSVSSVQSLSRVWLCNTRDCSMSGFAVHHQLLACSNSCSSSQWCHPTVSSSVVPFSSGLQSFLASGSFPMSQFFTSGGQSIGVSASASSEYSGLISFRIDLLDLLAVQQTQESSPTPQFKSVNSSALSFLYSTTLISIHDYWKNHSFD